MRKSLFALFLLAVSAFFVSAQNITEGSLYARNPKGVELGSCPLKHTKVVADISGAIARVTVTQEFENNFTEAIEAVYTFPLSQNAAVDRMTMRVGERVIRGEIKRREEARRLYEQAKEEGRTASLLDQQRPNIFTQSVANIMPGEKILIEISYVETLKYEEGTYEFVFPMTVGPRYIPGSVSAAEARLITPPVAETRAGHDVSLEVNLDAGVPVEGILSTSHPIAVTNLNAHSARVALREAAAIPNKDFVLRYDVTGKRVEDAVLAHRSESGGFFTLILQPPDAPAPEDVTPKEIVFVLDTSGSMNGFPLEKAKEAMRLSLDNLNPQDTFNLITFAGDTSVLFEAPVPATAENLALAHNFLASRRGAGGTEMMKAIRAALAPTESQKHLRIVCFMTDGYVGNEAAIIAEIEKHPNARVFSFGIGSSVNRFLLDKMAEAGRGEVEYVSLNDDGSRAARRFYQRVRAPMLTDISIDWNNLPVADVYPEKPGDLFSAKPIVISGRYTRGASGAIRLRGKVAGQIIVRDIPVALPEKEPGRDALASLWARRRVDALMTQLYRNAQNDEKRREIEEQITALGLEFRLLTQFTSFVAVEDRIVNRNGRPVRVEVPVELPEGVNRETTIGDSQFQRVEILANLQRAPQGSFDLSAGGSGVGRGAGQGSGTGQVMSAEKKTVNALSSVSADGLTASNNAGALNGKPDAKIETTGAGGALEQILKRLENHQKALTSLRANVVSAQYDAQRADTRRQTGNLIYLPGKDALTMRVDWTQPRVESLSIVGNEFVLYLPALKRAVTGKMSATSRSAMSFFFTLDAAKLKNGYAIKYLGESRLGGVPVWRLELVPKDESDFQSIELWINGDGMPLQIKASESGGDWSTLTLTNLQKNTAVAAKDLRIELPKDTEIVKN